MFYALRLWTAYQELLSALTLHSRYVLVKYIVLHFWFGFRVFYGILLGQ